MTDRRTWVTLVERAGASFRAAEARRQDAQRAVQRAQDRLERLDALLASAEAPGENSSSSDFLQYRAYLQKLQQLHARLEREIFVLEEDSKAAGREAAAAGEVLRRYEAVLARNEAQAAKAAQKAEQRALEAVALSRFLSTQRGLLGGAQ